MVDHLGLDEKVRHFQEESAREDLANQRRAAEEEAAARRDLHAQVQRLQEDHHARVRHLDGPECAVVRAQFLDFYREHRDLLRYRLDAEVDKQNKQFLAWLEKHQAALRQQLVGSALRQKEFYESIHRQRSASGETRPASAGFGGSHRGSPVPSASFDGQKGGPVPHRRVPVLERPRVPQAPIPQAYQQQQQPAPVHPPPRIYQQQAPPILAPRAVSAPYPGISFPPLLPPPPPSQQLATQSVAGMKRPAEQRPMPLPHADSPALKRPRPQDPPPRSAQHDALLANISLPTRTVAFSEVYGDGTPEFKHYIVRFPASEDGADFYILRCQEHGVHFGLSPIQGAAKHLHSMAHGNMPKHHSLAIQQLGYRVTDCTQELVDKNNDMVTLAFQSGYQSLNRKKTLRAALLASDLEQGASAPASGPPRIIAARPNPVPQPTVGSLYLAQSNDVTHPALLVLGWGLLDGCGFPGQTLRSMGLLDPRRRDKVPPCYLIDWNAVQIVGWGAGYEDGGSLESRRWYPVACFTGNECQLHFYQAKSMIPFPFDDATESNPHYQQALQVYAGSKGYASYGEMKAKIRRPIAPVDTTNVESSPQHISPRPYGPGPSLGSSPRASGLSYAQQSSRWPEQDGQATRIGRPGSSGSHRSLHPSNGSPELHRSSSRQPLGHASVERGAVARRFSGSMASSTLSDPPSSNTSPMNSRPGSSGTLQSSAATTAAQALSVGSTLSPRSIARAATHGSDANTAAAALQALDRLGPASATSRSLPGKSTEEPMQVSTPPLTADTMSLDTITVQSGAPGSLPDCQKAAQANDDGGAATEYPTPASRPYDPTRPSVDRTLSPEAHADGRNIITFDVAEYTDSSRSWRCEPGEETLRLTVWSKNGPAVSGSDAPVDVVIDPRDVAEVGKIEANGPHAVGEIALRVRRPGAGDGEVERVTMRFRTTTELGAGEVQARSVKKWIIRANPSAGGPGY